jgi:6-phosphogluconolactonase
MSVELKVLEDPAAACAGLLLDAAGAGADVVLAGGSTPRAAYAHAASAEADWSRATLWFGDERCVPPDDERSNYKMVKEALLDALAGRQRPVPTVKRIPGELGPEPAADAYEDELRAAGPPRFELVVLGLGPDGHTASLFPDQATLAERSRLVVPVPEAGLEPFVPRVSLSLPALASARLIVFLVAGASKADAVAKAFGPNARPDPHVPASMLAQLAEQVTVLLDADAAARV